MTQMKGARRLALVCLGLALAGMLVFAGRAHGARYAVSQCGWHIGQDAEWLDTTGGGKFRPDSYCATPAGEDPFAAAHMKSFTRDGAATVSGTRFARWRWDAPAGTGITAIRGTWWHALHDGIEHRIGSADGGSFDVFAAAASTDTAPREFSAGFSSPRQAIEDRLLCARGEDKSCSLADPSFSSIRAVTLTLDDPSLPRPGIGGDLVAGGWRRGTQPVAVAASDNGSGVRFSQVLVDSTTTGISVYDCRMTEIGGEIRGTRLKPCEGSGSAWQSVVTPQFSDGPHAVRTCASDFSGNYACTTPQTIQVDNNAPSAPRQLALTGGDGWRRVNGFAVTWANPDQGLASPIAGASYRVVGPEGYDSGVQFVAGDGIASLGGLIVPRAGTYLLSVWLRDAAGNENPGNAAYEALRFDDVAPTAAFAASEDPAHPEELRATFADTHSGVVYGDIAYRRVGRDDWTSLRTDLVPAPGTSGELHAHFPSDDVPDGTYEMRATVVDGAGNITQTGLREDGTAMRIDAPLKARTRLAAWVRGAGRPKDSVTTRFAAPVMLSGRLTRADGSGVSGVRLAVVVRPSEGATARRSVLQVRSGAHGGFSLHLPAGPSRRLVVRFAGTDSLTDAASRALAVRVRSGVVLHAAPRALQTGEAVTLSGRVSARGARIPRRGKLVAIQYLESESDRWRPVLVTRTDRAGRFHARYRFRYITATAHIRLRATALPEAAWPYAPGHSPPATVTVRG